MSTRKALKLPTRAGAMLLLAPFLVGCGEGYETVTVPAGTQVTVRLEDQLSTQSNDAGDSFLATVAEPLVVEGETVAPQGTAVRGELTELERSGKVDGRARMTLAFQEAEGPGGTFHDIPAQPITIEADPGTREDLEKVSAGAIAGAIIGGLTEGGKGAAIGAAIGAGAGGLVVVTTRGEDLTLEKGQVIRVTLAESVEIPVNTPGTAQAEQDTEMGADSNGKEG